MKKPNIVENMKKIEDKETVRCLAQDDEFS